MMGKYGLPAFLLACMAESKGLPSRIWDKNTRKSFRIGRMIIDVSNDIDPRVSKYRVRLFNLGSKNSHATVLFFWVSSWLVNIRTSSMAD